VRWRPLTVRLARAGLRVAVVDLARFPSDVASTHTIQSSGVAALRDLGVVDHLLARTSPIERVTLALDDARAEIGRLSEIADAPMLCLRRPALDQVLLDAAEAAGAAVLTQTAVRELLIEGGRVVGVRTSRGELRPPLVVGADGTHSTVARQVGAEDYATTAPQRTFLWAYLADVCAERDHAWIGKVDDVALPCLSHR
jgi:2-polyprenyl-6-methoxyphenol hydroxylase-like FAD-dependent oxidoreductase